MWVFDQANGNGSANGSQASASAQAEQDIGNKNYKWFNIGNNKAQYIKVLKLLLGTIARSTAYY